jgi:hypothetical protein
MWKRRKSNRLYVLIDESLDPVYGCVQGGHAVAQYMLEHRFSRGSWKNEYLIYLSCDIMKWKEILERKHKRFSAFFEPDLKSRLTAIAVVDDGEMFRNLSLIRCGS